MRRRTFPGGPPTIERIPINETVVDEALLEECWVDVLTTARGHAILRTYHRAGAGPIELTTST